MRSLEGGGLGWGGVPRVPGVADNEIAGDWYSQVLSLLLCVESSRVRGVVGFGIVLVGGLRRGSTGHFLRTRDDGERVHRQHEEHSCRGRTSSRAPEGAERRKQVHRQHEEYSSGGSTSSEAPEGAERREQVRRQHEEHSSTSLLRPREQHDGNTFAVNKRRTRHRRWFGWFEDFHQPRKREKKRDCSSTSDTKGMRSQREY